MRKTRGVGSVYQPRYRNAKTGELQASAVWWIRYSHHGVRHRENSHSEVHAEAADRLKLRIGQAGIGKPVTAAIGRTTLDDLAKLVFADYVDEKFDSLARQEDAFDHLRAFFGGDCLVGGDCPAHDITVRIPDYKKWRQEQPDRRADKRNGSVEYKQAPRIGCATATINRELAALRHAFKLAHEHVPKLVADVPTIKLSKERNRRTGFFEWEQFVEVRKHLPDHLKPVMTVAYYTGWRVPSEIITRQKKHVVNGMLVLDAYETKNEQSRKFPLDVIPELRETIEQQIEATRKIEVETGRVIPWLFPGRYGNQIKHYLPAFHAACTAAGCAGRIPHDFRRTAARNLINAEVDPLTTMELVGWTTITMLKRYNIIGDETLKRGVAKLAVYLAEQKEKALRAGKKVIAIR